MAFYNYTESAILVKNANFSLFGTSDVDAKQKRNRLFREGTFSYCANRIVAGLSEPVNTFSDKHFRHSGFAVFVCWSLRLTHRNWVCIILLLRLFFGKKRDRETGILEEITETQVTVQALLRYNVTSDNPERLRHIKGEVDHG